MQTLIAMKAMKAMKATQVTPMKATQVKGHEATQKFAPKPMKATRVKAPIQSYLAPSAMNPEEKNRRQGHLIGFLARQTIPGCGHNCIGEIRQQRGDEYLLLFFKGVGRRGSIWLKRNEFVVICHQ